MVRPTKAVREKLLRMNENFSRTTYNPQKNFSITTRYTIRNGKLYYQESGKTSWADSRFSEPEYEADEGQTHRFLKKWFDEMDYDENE